MTEEKRHRGVKGSRDKREKVIKLGTEEKKRGQKKEARGMKKE
jgi:hypothetical protein